MTEPEAAACERVRRERDPRRVRDSHRAYLDLQAKTIDVGRRAERDRRYWRRVTRIGLTSSCVTVVITAVLAYQYSAFLFGAVLVAAVPLQIGGWALVGSRMPQRAWDSVTFRHAFCVADLRSLAYDIRADHLRHHTRSQYDTVVCEAHDGLTDGRPLGPAPE